MINTNLEDYKHDLTKYKKLIGIRNVGKWHMISSSDVKKFGALTNNKQFIHTNKYLASKYSPYNGVVAHAYMILSLIPNLTGIFESITPNYNYLPVVLNYGFDKVRFIRPTYANQNIRAISKIISVEAKNDSGKIGILIKQQVEIESKNESLVCVAESILYLWYGVN